MITVIYNFGTATDYTYDSSKIEVSGGMAALKSPYSTSNPKIKNATVMSVSSIGTIEATESSAGNDTIKYTLEVDGTEKWYNSSTSMWETSSGYAQSNTLAEIADYLDSLFEDYCELRFVAYLHSDNGSTTPSLLDVTLTVDFHGIRPSDPDKVVVWGYLYNSTGAAVSGVRVSAKLPDIYTHTTTKIKMSTASISTVTESDGYWELELVPNSALTPTGSMYMFTFSGVGFDVRDELKIVPSGADTRNYSDI